MTLLPLLAFPPWPSGSHLTHCQGGNVATASASHHAGQTIFRADLSKGQAHNSSPDAPPSALPAPSAGGQLPLASPSLVMARNVP